MPLNRNDSNTFPNDPEFEIYEIHTFNDKLHVGTYL